MTTHPESPDGVETAKRGKPSCDLRKRASTKRSSPVVLGAGRWEAAGAGRGFEVDRVEHRRPRDTGGTLPGRSSCVWNVVTPSGSGRQDASGQSTVRKTQFPGGIRMTREANAGGRKAAGNRDNRRPLRRQSRITGRIGRCPTRKGADAGQVSLCSDDDDDTGTEGQVGRHDNDSDGDAGCGGCGERTGGRPP